jgi:photosystem II stability/assembly factor-like uncharacterized protein
VTFANSRVGWIFGTVPTRFKFNDVSNSVERFWATTDGGSSWTSLKLSRLDMALGVQNVTVANGRAYLVGTSVNGAVSVRTTAVGSNRWTPMKTPLMSMDGPSSRDCDGWQERLAHRGK